MKLAMVQTAKGSAIAILDPQGKHRCLYLDDESSPGTLDQILQNEIPLESVGGKLLKAPVVSESDFTFLSPLSVPRKIICVGLNYLSHAEETKFEPPVYPTFFMRVATSLVSHSQPIVRPLASQTLDFEGEFVAVIGRGGKHISRESALDHVAGYSIFNDASVREYQMKTSQWTIGKNFDATGAFGPYLVTANELPGGAVGLEIQTRLNGVVMQQARTSEMIFDVKTLVSILSESITLQAGDIIVTGTPGGVGFARDPKIFMKAGDVCEVEVEGIGVLRNTVVDEQRY